MADDDTRQAKIDRFVGDIGRVGAFSDGVFGIAMTLLVLNFRTPNLSGGDLDQKLWDFVSGDYQLLISYGLSAFVISRYWLAHHRMFRLVRRLSPTLLELNLLSLALIALVPWPTELLGRYGDTSTAVVVYAGTVAITGLVHSWMWHHAWKGSLLDPDVTETYGRHALFRGLSLPAVYLVSIPIAFVDPTAAELSWLLLVPARMYAVRHWGSIHSPFDG